MLNVSSDGMLRRLYRHISPRRRRQLSLLLCLMLVGAVAELVTLGAVLPFLGLMSQPDSARNHRLLSATLRLLGSAAEEQPLLAMTAVFSFVAVAAASIRVALSWFSNRLIFMLAYDLGIEVYKRILHQPYAFFASRNSSEIIASIGNVQVITTRVLLPLLQVLISAIIAISILAGLLLIDARTASIAGVGFASIYLAINLAMRRRLHANSRVVAQAQKQRIQAIQEGIGGIRNVLLDNTQHMYLNKFRSVDEPLRNAEAATSMIAATPRYLIEAISMMLVAIIAYRLSQQAGGVTAALPVLGALALGAQKLLPLLQQIYYGWTVAAGSWAVLSDVVSLLDLSPDAAHAADGTHSGRLPFEHSIQLRHLCFRYSADGPWILNDLNLTIPKGTRCGIIGKTGGGKSTAFDIVMGLLEPCRGELLIDDHPVNHGNLRSWQARIAHVPQTIYLSDASIAANIAFGVDPKDVDFSRVEYAARQAQITEFIDAQPHGYETLVGERGVRLSGGQRQRIAIARALYKRADVLLLDEATSALDDTTEKAVIECIDGLDRDLTILIIAHRLSTVRNCDLVVKLEGGSIAAIGSYEQVVTDAGPNM